MSSSKILHSFSTEDGRGFNIYEEKRPTVSTTAGQSTAWTVVPMGTTMLQCGGCGDQWECLATDGAEKSLSHQKRKCLGLIGPPDDFEAFEGLRAYPYVPLVYEKTFRTIIVRKDNCDTCGKLICSDNHYYYFHKDCRDTDFKRPN